MSTTRQSGAPLSEGGVLGVPGKKIDGQEKITGAAVFTDDMTLPGMLHGAFLRSPHAHAAIRSPTGTLSPG